MRNELAREVLGQGVELRAPRKLWFGTRRLDAEETAARLDTAELTAREPGDGRSYPVRSEQDLRELAVFHAGRPLSELEHPELGQAVVDLQSAGFSLHDDRNRPLSLYGAYNAVTEPDLGLGPLTVQLADHGHVADASNLAQMAEFYTKNELGQLEIEGYHFFDARGNRRYAWGEEPPAMVGDGEPWIEATGDDLKKRLLDFEVLRQETESLALARQLAGLTPERFTEQAAPLTKEPRALPGLLRAAEKLTTEQLAEAGRKLELDERARAGWLDLLEKRPESGPAARLARALDDRDAFRAILSSPCPRDGAEAALLLRRLDGPGGAALAMLEEYPDTRPAAAAVKQWKGGAELVPALLEAPTDGSDARLTELALGHHGDNTKRQRSILSERAQSSPRARLGLAAFEAATTPELKSAIFERSLKAAELTGPGEVRALVNDLLRAISERESRRYPESREALARASLAALSELPATREAAETVLAWGTSRPEEVAFKLVDDPKADLWQLAASLKPEEAVHRKVLGQLPEPARKVAGLLYEKASYAKTREAVYQCALEARDLKSGLEAAELMGKIAPAQREDRSLGQAMLEVLQEFPDTREAAAQVAAWNPSRPWVLAQSLLRAPCQATPENLRRVAGDCALDDRSAQEGILAWLDHPPARKLLPQLERNEGRKAVVQAALRTPAVEAAGQAVAFYRDALDCGENDRGTVAAHALAGLQAFPETAPAARRIEGWQSQRQIEMARELLKAPTDASPARLREIAALADDAAAQSRILEELKQDPATSQAGTLGLELAPNLRPAGRTALVRAILAAPEIKTGADAAALLARVGTDMERRQDRGRSADQEALGQAIPAFLARYPDTREKAEKVIAWQPARHFSLSMALAQDPLEASPEGMRRLALSVDANDKALIARIFEETPCPATEVGSELLAIAGDPATRKSLLRAVMAHIEARSGPDVVALLRSIPSDGYDQDALGRSTLKLLQRFPETKEGAAVVESWAPGSPGPLARALLEESSLSRVALHVGERDAEAQRGILGWLGHEDLLATHGELRGGRARRALVVAAAGQGQPTDGAAAAALFGEALAGVPVDRNASHDRQVLCQAALARLQGYPDTRAAADTVAGWSLGRPTPVVTALLRNPVEASPEAMRALALEIEPHDAAGQTAVLAQLRTPAGEIGRKLMEQSPGAEARQAILRATLEHHDLKTGAEAAALLAQALEQAPDSVAAVGLEVLQQFPDTRPAAARVAGWQATAPLPLLKKLLEAPADDSVANLRAVAAAAEEKSLEFYQGILNGLAEPANRDLGLAGLKHFGRAAGWRAWSTAVLTSPPVRSGEEAAGLVQSVWRGIRPDQRHKNEVGELSALAEELLARYPDTAEAARRYLSWGQHTPVSRRLELWMSDPTFSRPDRLEQAAEVCFPSDTVMQAALLDEKGGTAALMARAAQAEVDRDETRFAFFQAALEGQEVRDVEGVRQFFKRVRSKTAWERAKVDELEKLYQMSFGLQGRSSDTMSEEQGRLLVGGVVLKKREGSIESP